MARLRLEDRAPPRQRLAEPAGLAASPRAAPQPYRTMLEAPHTVRMRPASPARPSPFLPAAARPAADCAAHQPHRRDCQSPGPDRARRRPGFHPVRPQQPQRTMNADPPPPCFLFFVVLPRVHGSEPCRKLRSRLGKTFPIRRPPCSERIRGLMIFPSRGPMKAERENFSPDLAFKPRLRSDQIADIPIFVVVRSRRTSAPPALLTRRRPVLHGPRARGLKGIF